MWCRLINPLSHLENTKLSFTGKRWVAEICAFDYSVQYHTGCTNKNADLFSPVNSILGTSSLRNCLASTTGHLSVLQRAIESTVTAFPSCPTANLHILQTPPLTPSPPPRSRQAYYFSDTSL